MSYRNVSGIFTSRSLKGRRFPPCPDTIPALGTNQEHSLTGIVTYESCVKNFPTATPRPARQNYRRDVPA